MKKVRILNTWFETNGWGISAAKFTAGQELPLDAETARQVELGNAVEFEAQEEAVPDAADAPAQVEATPTAAPKKAAKAAAAA